jgi:hypothetical protein
MRTNESSHAFFDPSGPLEENGRVRGKAMLAA